MRRRLLLLLGREEFTCPRCWCPATAGDIRAWPRPVRRMWARYGMCSECQAAG